MSCRLILVLCLITLLFSGCTRDDSSQSTAPVASININLTVSDTPLGQLAQTELCMYLEKLFTNPVVINGKQDPFHMVIGTPESNDQIQRLVQQAALKLPDGANSEQGYRR